MAMSALAAHKLRSALTLLGVLVGVFAANRLASSFGWPILIQPDVIAIAVGFSGLVGVVFGLYPAQKAARLDPIDALRFE